MPKTAYPMTPLDTSRTVKRRNLRSGRTEIWAAYSASREDGVTEWGFERGEEPGTPWHIHHYPTQRVLESVAGSITQARRDTASGWALRELDRQDARRAELIAAFAAKTAA